MGRGGGCNVDFHFPFFVASESSLAAICFASQIAKNLHSVNTCYRGEYDS